MSRCEQQRQDFVNRQDREMYRWERKSPEEKRLKEAEYWSMLDIPMPRSTDDSCPILSLVAYGTLQRRNPKRQCPVFGYTGDHILTERRLRDLNMHKPAHQAGARRDILELIQTWNGTNVLVFMMLKIMEILNERKN